MRKSLKYKINKQGTIRNTSPTRLFSYKGLHSTDLSVVKEEDELSLQRSTVNRVNENDTEKEENHSTTDKNESSKPLLPSSEKVFQTHSSFPKKFVVIVLLLCLMIIGFLLTLALVKVTDKRPNKCPIPKLPNYSSMSCEKNNEVSSVCIYRCHTGYKLKGNASISCNTSLQWSDDPPACDEVCPQCHVGKDCSYSNSLKHLKNQIVTSFNSHPRIKINYAGNDITCSKWKYGFHEWNLKWKVCCNDHNSHQTRKCSQCVSYLRAVHSAAVRLIQSRIKKKVYPTSCDDIRSEEIDC